MGGMRFVKMHGLGNDFVVLDGRARALGLSAERVRAIADRHTGVGCDQVIAIEPDVTGLADAAMRIFNADGSEAEACGNATRCVASLLMAETGADHAVIETPAGLLDVDRDDAGLYTVDMGPARLEWREIPVAEMVDTLHLGISAGPLADPVAVNVGNPHAVFFVDDVDTVDLAKVGPVLERHRLFPERANIGVAQVMGRGEIRLRVWERGAGLTRACGSGACAAVVAAHRRNLTDRKVRVILDGGTLAVEWRDDGRVLMTGSASVSFTGEIDPGLLAPEA